MILMQVHCHLQMDLVQRGAAVNIGTYTYALADHLFVLVEVSNAGAFVCLWTLRAKYDDDLRKAVGVGLVVLVCRFAGTLLRDGLALLLMKVFG